MGYRSQKAKRDSLRVNKNK